MSEAVPWPFATSPWKLLALTVLLWGILYLLFRYVFALSPRGWKRLDYAWLGIAALGFFGAAGSVRRQVAPQMLDLERTLVRVTYSELKSRAEPLTSAATCRVFAPGLLAPDALRKLQYEYDAACNYGRQLASVLPDTATSDIDTRMILRRPVASDAILEQTFAALDLAQRDYDSAAARVVAVTEASSETYEDLILAVASPLLLALALAIRLAKVTWEVSRAS